MLRTRWAAVGAVIAICLGAGGLTLSHAALGPTEARRATSFVPIAPVRLLDTRSGAPLAAGGTHTLTIGGTPSVPAYARAAVLNVTVDQTTADSYLTVWPADKPRPTASNLNWKAGVTIPNLVTVALSADGRASFYNEFGTTHLIVDAVGYYVAAGLKTVDLTGAIHGEDGTVFESGFEKGFILPNTGLPSLSVPFVLPPDYTPGTPLTIEVMVHMSDPAATACNLNLRPNFVSHGRVGVPHSGVTQSGLEPVSGSTVVAVPSNTEIAIARFIAGPTDPAVPLEPGDKYHFGFFRETRADDTCVDALYLDSIVVKYE